MTANLRLAVFSGTTDTQGVRQLAWDFLSLTTCFAETLKVRKTEGLRTSGHMDRDVFHRVWLQALLILAITAVVQRACDSHAVAP